MKRSLVCEWSNFLLNLLLKFIKENFASSTYYSAICVINFQENICIFTFIYSTQLWDWFQLNFSLKKVSSNYGFFVKQFPWNSSPWQKLFCSLHKRKIFVATIIRRNFPLRYIKMLFPLITTVYFSHFIINFRLHSDEVQKYFFPEVGSDKCSTVFIECDMSVTF